ncbi:MAG: glycosyltransferase family 4 protein [Opitutales bacterium]
MPIERPRIVYLFTTFPKLSETFLQREIRALREEPLDLEIHSIYGGDPTFEGQVVHRFPMASLITLVFWLPYWLVRGPRHLCRLLGFLSRRPRPNFLNFQETLLGLAHGLILARRLAASPPRRVHAVWATMPASSALAIHVLTGIPFSMGAHAYDIFQDGGDWLLPEKIQRARFIHCSSRQARSRVLALGADPDRVHAIYRGLEWLPPAGTRRATRLSPLRILSVGRLMPKKGFLYQLSIYDRLQARGIRFFAHIVGDGDELGALLEERGRLGLDQHVKFLGELPFNAVEEQYRWADLFLFTGRVTRDGDRDGLPNVIGEALAHGLPVLTTPGPGALEAIEHGRTGLVCDANDPEAWADTLERLIDDGDLHEDLSLHGRAWVEHAFNCRRNAHRLAALHALP